MKRIDVNTVELTATERAVSTWFDQYLDAGEDMVGAFDKACGEVRVNPNRVAALRDWLLS